MRPILALLPLAIGLTAIATVDVDLWTAHWLGVDLVILGASACAKLRQAGAIERSEPFPCPVILALPLITLLTVAGLGRHPHFLVSVEATMAGRMVSGLLAACVAWFALQAMSATPSGDGRLIETARDR